MIAYKLLSQRADGSLGPLFINKRQVIEPGVRYIAEEHLTKGYAFRPGWHSCSAPVAPHLSKKNRVWAKVRISGITKHLRPESQGGLWFTSKYLTVLEVL
jgi:aminoglycoside phosphotransferase